MGRRDRAVLGSGSPRLDLHEHQGRAVEGDQVELARTGAGVALHEAPSLSGEATRDEILGGAAQALSGGGHRSSLPGGGRPLMRAWGRNRRGFVTAATHSRGRRA
jgi:hypothetical protein